MLLRDLGAGTVWQDIATWLDDPGRALPSGADATARRVLSGEDVGFGDVAADGAADSDTPAPNPIPTLAGSRG
jgi:hypothetical protein